MKMSVQKFLCIFALIVFCQMIANACDCSGEPNFQEMFENSDAVIKGKVVMYEGFDLEIFALINVESSWKGINEKKVIVKTDPGSCGVKFEVGETYYLWVDKLDNSFVTMPCRNYGEKQISFLKDKPTLSLKNSDATIDENSNSENNITESVNENSNVISKPEKKPLDQPNYVLIFTISVISLVFVVIISIMGFLFWKHKKQ